MYSMFIVFATEIRHFRSLCFAYVCCRAVCSPRVHRVYRLSCLSCRAGSSTAVNCIAIVFVAP